MRKTLLRLLAATAVAATAIPFASVAAQPSTVKWGRCPEDVAGPVLQCATVEVPLDYRNPDGQHIEIMISKLESKNPAKRRGVLMTNAGGPGIAALGFGAVLAASGLPPQLLDSYDVISFDPRGVGHSTPVTCNFTPEQQKRGIIPAYAHTAADVEREAVFARTVAEQCANSPTAWMLPHTTTANTARDMDRIRAALGQEKVSYLAPSYGTYLGAVYTTMFPERTDRVVLDSSLPAAGYDVTFMRGFGRGTQDRFPDFAAFAAAHPEYGLGTTSEQVRAKYFDLAARLEAEPVQGIGATAFRDTMLQLLYDDSSLPLLAEFMQALDTDQPLPPIPAIAGLENAMSARLAVICDDRSWPETVQEYQRNAEVDRVRYPLLGGATANIGPCAFWPTEPIEPPVQIGDQGPSNVLIVQYQRDPGTPLVGAEDMRRAFGGRATMIVVDQGGHVVIPFSRNKCAIDTTTAFLTTGQRPAQDLACAAEPSK
ncbi:alpha/beta hydrolase [Nocardia sp. NBC_00508]|uniref:alpha/beta hydrolase n=1 Tax=Nocardia sp. NBC_00508 TaxID=2975992 RepID=UPI002E810C3B|nr:alpha/beta hydrolase [Nocardia sp. NBC_00508]WUD64483.1 alpha/beta hydrolase [Nocardia sp. NBC_00508]